MEQLGIGFCSACFAWVAYLLVKASYKTLYLKWRGTATMGTTVELLRTTDDGDVFYFPVVTFSTPDGTQKTVKSSFGSTEAGTYFRVGEQVPILYSPQDPMSFTIVGYETAGLFLLFLVAAVFFLVLGISLSQ